MVDINLLPWREAKREQEKKSFYALLAGASAIAVGVIFLLNYYVNSSIYSQTNRNLTIKNEINLLNRNIKSIKDLKEKKASLISRMTIVNKLENSRIIMVHLFDEVVKIMPDGVYLTQLKREGDKIMLLGYSESNTNISLLMRNIEDNPWIKDPILTEIKKSSEKQETAAINEFQLSFSLQSKKDSPKKNENNQSP